MFWGGREGGRVGGGEGALSVRSFKMQEMFDWTRGRETKHRRHPAAVCFLLDRWSSWQQPLKAPSTPIRTGPSGAVTHGRVYCALIGCCLDSGGGGGGPCALSRHLKE